MKAIRITERVQSIFVCLLMMISFSACSRGPSDWVIEHDKYDPRIHGQIIRFNKPMAYSLLKMKDIERDFTQESINIGRWLVDLDSAEDMDAGESDHRRLYEATTEREFKIVRSYWIRHDWYKRAFVGDTHHMVLEDRHGIVSFANTRAVYLTNRKELQDIFEESLNK